MTRTLRAVAGVFSYFTILPMGRSARTAPDAYALTLLPIVGIVVGALAGLSAYVLRAHAQVGYGAAFLTTLVVTGAIHVDGYLDACDALFAPVHAERRLEIMRDVRHGTFAVVGMSVLAWTWWAALQRYDLTMRFVFVLAFVCALARLAAVANAWIFPYARAGEATPPFAQRPPVALAALVTIVVAAIGYALAPAYVLAVPAAIVAGVAIGWWMSTKLGGGLTGDCYGFGVVVMEALLMLVLPQ